ncbi:hypothetical protein C5167_036169 [Papaver somniferum]|uniref:glutathione S-transferase T3-like n=1 Tax=Papaver somniferum TaxID=3469 RepID=UPI000E6F5D5B|nr:glutathione S-transferase T3-like [Papaver somniferum]RZC87628.1 hypothetical protein C5167_036169 [Papaver somniferum]
MTKAYLYVSVDSIVGKDQTSERMWNRILGAWRENMGTYDESRKANGLSCRWGLIQAAVTKFHAAYESVERAPKSGVSIENVKRDELRIYKETGDGSAFKFEHCWEILKENPKWCSLQLTRTGTSKKEKKTGESLVDSLAQTSLTSSLPDGVADVDNENIDAEQGVSRPPGKNTIKAKLQKAHEQKNIAGILSSFQTTVEKQHLLNQQELELKKEKDKKDHELMEILMKKELELKEKDQQLKEEAQRQKQKLGKRKECERIMTTDLTPLQPAIRKVYEQMQAKIIKEWEEEGLLGDDWLMI